MKNAVKTSRQEQANAAVDELSCGVENPSLVIFFAPEIIFEEVSVLLQKKFPDARTMGTTTRHTYDRDGHHTDFSSATYFFSDIECSGDFIPEIDSFPLKYAQRIQDAVNRLSSTSDSICLSFTTAYSNSEELVITALDTVCTENGMKVVGGTSGVAASEDERTMVALDGKVHRESTVFMCIKNLSGRIKVYKENVYIPTKHQFTATSVDIKNRTIMELDRRPAAEVLSLALGCQIPELKEQLERQPIGRITENEIYISAIEKILADGSTKWSARVYNNTKVSLLKIGDWRTTAEQTIAKIKRDFPEPSHVLLIHCDARTNLYQRQGKLEEFSKIYSSAFASLSGFSSHGEQLGKVHFNLTLLAVVFE